MSLPGILPWTDQNIILYHGTGARHAASILQGIKPAKCRHLRDFGRGFYTTTNLQQAGRWARDLVIREGGAPAVVRFEVERNRIAGLDSLIFVRGDRDAFDYWSFVEYCRTTARDHNRSHAPWYDMVAGPVTGSWKKMTTIPDADQISFHTDRAIAELDSSRRSLVP